MLRLLTVVCICVARWAQAQEPGNLTEFEEGLTFIYKDVIHGREVPIRGALGTFITEDLTFVDNTGSYDVKLDASREARRSLEGCEVNPFDWKLSDCIISGRAELTVDFPNSSVSDGYEIDLIIFEMTIEERR